ncbi:MAG TPA: hypothetical protein VLD37_07395 [Candidatus Bilamarchaeum sp.]|nr:hypothetical protein [Candidatus Bilamarchaeum sp.]
MDAEGAVAAVWGRLLELLSAPLSSAELLWAAIPLFIATLFIALYFGRNRSEELGWNTAFGNTMVFLFVAIGLIQKMYNSGGLGSLANITSSGLYFTITVALALVSILMMAITYFHLMPKRAAFFLFSAPPLNSAAYVVMTIVYGNVPPDWVTAAAGIIFLFLILVVVKALQVPLWLISVREHESSGDMAVKAEDEPGTRRRRVRSRNLESGE